MEARGGRAALSGMTKHIIRAALAAAAVIASLGPAATAEAATKCYKPKTEIVGGSSADRQVAVTACRAPGRHAPQSTKGWREYGCSGSAGSSAAADSCVTKIRTVLGPDSNPSFSSDPITGDCRNVLGRKGGTWTGPIRTSATSIRGTTSGISSGPSSAFELRKGFRRNAGRCAWSQPVRGKP